MISLPHPFRVRLASQPCDYGRALGTSLRKQSVKTLLANLSCRVYQAADR
jgi:hypothetical protein